MRMLLLLLPLALTAGCGAQAETRVDPPPEPAAQAQTRVDPKAPQGAIGGRIQFAGGVTPAMRICAVSTAAQQCIDSPAGRTLYRIGNLPDGQYQVVARVDNAQFPIGGHVEEVQCKLTPCLSKLVVHVISEGKEIATADLNGFYAERKDFPALPD